MIINFLRAVAWALLISIVVMTVVPPTLRVVNGAPHNVEHAMIFLIPGAAFGLGYELRLSVMCAAALLPRPASLSRSASRVICSPPSHPVAMKGAVGTALDNPISASSRIPARCARRSLLTLVG
jgi:hypothetical protein